MKCNGYDFDKTIYNGDCTLDFYIFCISRKKRCLLDLPNAVIYFFLYVIGIVSKTRFKEAFYQFLKRLDHVEMFVAEFALQATSKISAWYSVKHQSTDVIISASPEFLVSSICKEIGITNVIASRVDIRTGRYEGENCRGYEKVRRFQTEYPQTKLEEFYSDSITDLPMAEISQKAYLVKGNRIVPWKRSKII